MKVTGRSQDKRLWLGGGAVLALLIVLAGWFMVVNPQLSAASATRDQAAAARDQNATLQTKNSKLKEQNDDTGALRSNLSAALAQLPSDGGLPSFTRQLSAQATSASVLLTSVIIGPATPVTGAVGQAVIAPAAAEASATPAAGATAAAAVPASGLVQMLITLTATGLGRHDLAFLRAIQWNGPRRALVTAVQLAPSGSGSASAGGASTGTGVDGPCTLSLTLTIFSAPMSPSAQAALEKLLSGK